MTGEFPRLTLHVPNVWQTCNWYRQVFGFNADFSADGTVARLHIAGYRLVFAAHDALETDFGPRRRNSFLFDPPAFHLDIATADVATLFDHALTHGGVAVRPPEATPTGQRIATLCDLNGILIRL